MSLYCELDTLVTESDVEQKFIYQFLNADLPTGLGLMSSEILTKRILRQRLIGKGQTQKYYYPDYLVSFRGIPVLVVEAKKPGEKLENGYSEARLYAQEVNASFPHGVNACQYIIACNGNEMWAGYTDQAEPLHRLLYSDFAVENKSFCDLVDFCSRVKLLAIVNKYFADARGNTRFDSPVAKLGGRRVQNAEMVENSFGRTLVFENRAIFDPETEHDRTIIVRNAYISSPRREQHAEPMYKEIRQFESPSQKNSTMLSTEEPGELVGKLSEKIKRNQEAYSLLLLIGNVGSGKTTFIRYFKHVFLAENHPELSAKCEWIFINMNSAPVSKEVIYTWLKEKIITCIRDSHTDMEFDDYNVIQRVFRREITSFNKGLGSILRSNQDSYNQELFKLLNGYMNNHDVYLNALLFFLKENYAKIPIVVLDNCDKRNKDEQLLMFEVAQWLRTQYSCIVLLPMRDSTYDTYKSEPPLDTVVRDLVFRIDPPDLLRVLQARLDYITRTTEQTSSTYVVENGMQVAVKRLELIEYFKLIMVAIRKDRWIANLFYRLSNKNTRNGIQIFEDFCKSGHMKTKDILSMRILGDEANVPTYRFENVLLRKNRRFYNGNESNFINLFASDYSDDFPDPFIRVDILWWLRSISGKEGPSKVKGLFSVALLSRNLQVFGHSVIVIDRELAYLIKRGLVFCENTSGQVSEEDLIQITIPGSLHLNMLNNVAYLAACAEDTLFRDTEIMMRISNRLGIRDNCSKLVSALNARDLVAYLEGYRKDYIINCYDLLSENTTIVLFDLSASQHAVDQWIKMDAYVYETVSRIDSIKEGKLVSASVVSKKNNGIVCKIDGKDIKGFTSTQEAKYTLPYNEYSIIRLGDVLSCRIIEYDFEYKSFQLQYIERVVPPSEQELSGLIQT